MKTNEITNMPDSNSYEDELIRAGELIVESKMDETISYNYFERISYEKDRFV